MKKRFLPLCMLLITMVLAQASMVANAAEVGGKYTPRTESNATFSSFMKSIRANQETGLIDPAWLIAGQKAAQASRDSEMDWESAGPDNFGGPTRAVIYDNSGNLLIGTMGGDIFKTTNDGITFQLMAHVDAIISCFAMKDNVLYIGTGDGFGAQKLNGLSMLGYETSFVGSGVYKLEGNNAVQVSGTNDIEFVNEMTVVGNDIYAATSEGLYKNWTKVLDGNFRSVKSNNNGDVLAADEKDVFLSIEGGEFVKKTVSGAGNLPGNNSNPKIIAMSPSDKNIMYVAFLNGASGSYKTNNIYFTADHGETWEAAYTATSVMYTIFGSQADYTGFMVVYPDNPRKLLIGSDNLWVLEDATGSGLNSYRPIQISEYNCSQYAAIAWNRYFYLHQGIMNIVFNKTNPNTFFIGTEGGIFKGEYRQELYSYKSGNRYLITEDNHTATTRMMSVAVGGGTKVIGGSLEHGTIKMQGCDTIDNVTTGKAIFPNPTATNNAFGYFTRDYAGGPCFASTVDQNILIVSGTGNLDMPLHRSQTDGEDYDLTKFSSQGVITNKDVFRTPFAMYENYNDNHTFINVIDKLDTYNQLIDSIPNLPTDSIIPLCDTMYIQHGNIIEHGVLDTIWPYSYLNVNDTLYELIYGSNDTTLLTYLVLHNVIDTTTIYFDTLTLSVRRNAKAGDICHYYSVQGGYPLDYTMPEPPHDSEHVDPNGGYMWIPGDSISGLHDPIKTNLITAVKVSNKNQGNVYMTRDALIFNKDTEWFLINTINGIPSAVAMNANGTEAFVGTFDGNFYKYTNIDEAFSAEQAKIADTLNPCVEMVKFEDPQSLLAGRSITSICVNPNNYNDIVVTLGNYGNDDYVFRSTDGGTSFISIQGNLGKFPVYSSVIEKGTGLIILGTEHGIYTSQNGTSWSKSGNISCPVMDIKQAIMENRDDVIDILYDEMGGETRIVYPGIHNEGMIYAATYGNGIVKCGTYKEGSDYGVDEVLTDSQSAQVNVYPNPVRGNAQFVFTTTENANVSYQIFDLSGRMVEYRVLGFYTEGEHTATISTENLTTGSYIIRVLAGNKINTGKFLVY